jgi:hypothetical protein
MVRRFFGLVSAGLALFLAAGCGSVDTRKTVEQLTNARVAVEAAANLEDKAHPSDDLRHAQDALAIAQDAYANKAFERAFGFAKKATLYALVAKALTDQRLAEQKLAQVKEQLNGVMAQINSSSQPTAAAPQAASPTAQPFPPPAAGPAPEPAQKGVQP